MAMVFCIYAEGFNEQYGDGRTNIDYYFIDNKYIENNRGEKLPYIWDLWDEFDGYYDDEYNKIFIEENEFYIYLLKLCDDLSMDKYYNKIYIGCDNEKITKYLNFNYCNALSETDKCIQEYFKNDMLQYCLYPIKSTIKIKTLKNHKTSNKENVFIEICKKYIIDLETQVMLTINNKNFIVDGFSKTNNLIIEFLGDYYHGNPNIYEKTYYNDKLKKTAGELHEQWEMRKKIFNDLNYKLIYLWEHDYDKMTKKDINHWVSQQINI